MVQRVLIDKVLRPPVSYLGLIFDGKEAMVAMQEQVYQWWDQSRSSPAKQRVKEPVPDPQLQLLAWHDSSCSFPQALYQKFTQGSGAYMKLKQMQDDVEKLFPPPVAVTTTSGRTEVVTPRAVGRPDFNIEGGKRPLDVNREVDLQKVPAAEFNEPRPFTGRKHMFFCVLWEVGQCQDVSGGFPKV